MILIEVDSLNDRCLNGVMHVTDIYNQLNYYFLQRYIHTHTHGSKFIINSLSYNSLADY